MEMLGMFLEEVRGLFVNVKLIVVPLLYQEME